MSAVALVGTRKGLFQVSHNKQLEPVAFLGTPISMLLASDQHPIWYAALDHGHFGVKIHRSDDRGETWKEICAPSYPKAEESEEGDSLELIWSLAFAEHDKSNAIWAGTIPGGLFYSEDAGQSWVLNEALWQYKQQQQWFGGGYPHAGIHSICVDPDDINHITVAVSCAGVWVTHDKGQSWQNQSKGMRAAYFPPERQFNPSIQDPHRLVQCHGNARFMWVQHHNGIFRTTDGAVSWHELEDVMPSSFGFTVAVHPSDGNTAWFVPGIKDECRIPMDGHFVVTRTRDGGKRFTTLEQGLPSELSYDLVYRHGLDVDSNGERLIMGSTTGNLWWSDDQGDSWQCLSHHLPPVLVVSFLK